MKVLKNAIIVTMNTNLDIIKNGYIIINDNGDIEEIKEGNYSGENAKDMKGDLLIPGLINGHTHTAMTLLRGYADDLPLIEWLEKHIWPKEGEWMNEKNVNLGTELGIMEMLACGTTSFCDGYFFTSSTVGLADKIGIRGLMAEGLIDFPTPNKKTPEEAFDYIKDTLNISNNKISRIVLYVHAPYTTSPLWIEKVSHLAKENDLLFVIHTAETLFEVSEIKKRYGKTPVEHCASLIPVETKTAMAHMVHLNDKDMDIAADRDFGVIHNPQSNLKLSSGIAEIAKMRKKGINVSIGTDGAASNNNLDIIEEMRTASLIGKYDDPQHLSAIETMKMATIEGAKVLHIDDETGSLEKGKSADIVRISLNGIESYPYFGNPYSFIVYAMNSRDVKMTMIKGNVLYENGEYSTIDADRVKSEVRKLQ